MSINKQDADKFKDKVEELVHKFCSSDGIVDQEKFLQELFPYAAKESKNYIPAREELASTHGTEVNDRQLDYNMFMLSIISICWAVRMRRVKSEEGQCHADITNCNEARILHKDIYNQWISLVEEALRALRLDPPLTQ
jgi:hypothetical protein